MKKASLSKKSCQSFSDIGYVDESDNPCNGC